MIDGTSARLGCEVSGLRAAVMSAMSSGPRKHGRRPSTTLAAFLIGLPLAAAILYGIHNSFPADSIVIRYIHHPVENVAVVLFCCALGTLGAKLWQSLFESSAIRRDPLPAWDGKPVPIDQAPKLLTSVLRLPTFLHTTYLVLRVQAVLDFLRQRGDASELDDQLRTLSDNDALALDNSYSLTRFITWAIPILGFLGTVLGITGAISGITPEKLEKDLSSVTDGLALSFDATALALGLTMITMFCTFLVERVEQGILDEVDRFVDANLAHRFERRIEAGMNTGALEQHTKTILEAVDKLVQRQAGIWAQALAGAEQRAAERLSSALETTLDKTLKTHTERLAEMEKRTAAHSMEWFDKVASLATTLRETAREQHAVLLKVGEGVSAQAAALAQMQHQERHLIQMQATLQQNLATLAGTGAFEQTLHTLNAAIHLLTSRVSPTVVQTPGFNPPGRPQAAVVTAPPLGKAA